MIVLSRRKGEAIVINNDITVTVIEIRGDKVRLGIEAPLDNNLHFKEVWKEINSAKIQVKESTDANQSP